MAPDLLERIQMKQDDEQTATIQASTFDKSLFRVKF